METFIKSASLGCVYFLRWVLCAQREWDAIVSEIRVTRGTCLLIPSFWFCDVYWYGKWEVSERGCVWVCAGMDLPMED